MYHFRKTRKRYERQKDSNAKTGCPFCAPDMQQHKIAESETFYIIKNGVAYDLWEGHTVVDHLLLVPKQHIEDLADLTDKQCVEMMRIVGDYEKRGYNTYARGNKSARRSVEHQHTHFIKINHERARSLLFVEKPYLLFKI